MTTSATVTKRWSCDLCGAFGYEPTGKGAHRAWDRHWYLHHRNEGA